MSDGPRQETEAKDGGETGVSVAVDRQGGRGDRAGRGRRARRRCAARGQTLAGAKLELVRGSR